MVKNLGYYVEKMQSSRLSFSLSGFSAYPRRTGRTSVDNAIGQGMLRQQYIARPKVKLLGGRRVFFNLEVALSGVIKALTLF
jgi:hypothetical protein